MKKKTLAIFLCLGLMLPLSACASIFAAEYYDSYPFVDEAGDYEGEGQEIRNYSMLKSAILELINSHTEQASFRFGSYSGSLIDDLAAVCVEIKNDDPLGAYAVSDISYDTSRIVSYYTSEISISYKKSAEEIKAVQTVNGLGEFGNHVKNFMESYGTKTVVKVYSSVINEEYIEELVHDYYRGDPLLTAMEPTVSVSAYPAAGAERIYEISLRYGEPAEVLLAMDAELTARVEELALSLGEGDSLSLALRLVQNLSDMTGRDEEACAHPGTAYGALMEGSDDPLGLAMACKALCDRLGISCYVVEGEYNDDGVRDHAWNIIGLDGEYYHVDVSRFALSSDKAFLLSDEDIWGEYYWTKDDYPKCAGSLGPEDVFEPPADEQPENTPEPTPELTPEPEVSPEPEPEPTPGENSENTENENN